jgi:hypothetical protein
MPCPSHYAWFYHPNNIGWGVQIIKLFIMMFSDALYIFNLFQSTSTCFRHVYCQSSGGIHCICIEIGTCYTFGLIINWPGQDWTQLLYIYNVFLLMMGNICPKHVAVAWLGVVSCNVDLNTLIDISIA